MKQLKDGLISKKMVKLREQN